MTLKLDNDPTTTRVQTRDGREAVILDYCPEQEFCLIGKVCLPRGTWAPESWIKDGRSDYTPSPNGLVNAPETPRAWWVNVMKQPDGQTAIVDNPFACREEADERASFYSWLTRIACVQVTEGEGLDEPEPEEQDYVLDRNGNKVRVGDLIYASIPDNDKLEITKIENKSVIFRNSEGVLRDLPADYVVLLKSNHTGGTDV